MLTTYMCMYATTVSCQLYMYIARHFLPCSTTSTFYEPFVMTHVKWELRNWSACLLVCQLHPMHISFTSFLGHPSGEKMSLLPFWGKWFHPYDSGMRLSKVMYLLCLPELTNGYSVYICTCTCICWMLWRMTYTCRGNVQYSSCSALPIYVRCNRHVWGASNLFCISPYCLECCMDCSYMSVAYSNTNKIVAVPIQDSMSPAKANAALSGYHNTYVPIHASMVYVTIIHCYSMQNADSYISYTTMYCTNAPVMIGEVHVCDCPCHPQVV